MNFTTPVVGSKVYLPITFPSGSFAGSSFEGTGCFVSGSSNVAGLS